MKNLLTLRQFKDTYREWYSKLRQLNEAKEVVSELRDYWLQELPPFSKRLDKLLQYSAQIRLLFRKLAKAPTI
ncbi:hypothetical protein BTM231_12410 [Helicobacter pylori]